MALFLRALIMNVVPGIARYVLDELTKFRLEYLKLGDSIEKVSMLGDIDSAILGFSSILNEPKPEEFGVEFMVIGHNGMFYTVPKVASLFEVYERHMVERQARIDAGLDAFRRIYLNLWSSPDFDK
jgi:hypothetical protein